MLRDAKLFVSLFDSLVLNMGEGEVERYRAALKGVE